MAASREFLLQLQGYGLTTAEIHYHLPTTRLSYNSMSGKITIRHRTSRRSMASLTIGGANSTARCTRSGSRTGG